MIDNQSKSKRGGKRVGAGRREGSLNKATQEIKDRIDEKISIEDQWTLLADLAISGNMKAVELLLYYRWGKPKESVDLNHSGNIGLTQLLQEIDGRTKGIPNPQR